MRLSRANIPLASEDRTHSQAIPPSPHYNLAPHFWPGFINLQHFCHSRWRNPVRLSKSGQGGARSAQSRDRQAGRALSTTNEALLVGLAGPGPKIRSTRVHDEIAAMSNQPCSKASNENANPDNPIISSMLKSS